MNATAQLPQICRRRSRATLLSLAVATLTLATACNFMMPRKKVGRLAPKLTIDRWFQSPRDAHANWLTLRGQVVVLNFWEPWDDGSIGALPHLNDLAAHYEALGNSVKFIHVTSQASTASLTRFTETIPIRGWIAMDPDKTVFTTFGVHEYPVTWLINGKGKVIAITKPKYVTEKVINAIMEGRTEVPIDEGFID